jgi:DNA repair photolyase
MNNYLPISNDAAGANVQAGVNASGELAPAAAAKKSAILPAKVLGEAPQGHLAPISASTSTILGKPVFAVNTSPLNMNSGFRHKFLCDGGTFTPGTACAYSCPYCYVEAMVIKQEQVRDILAASGKPFNEVVIRRNNAMQRLAQDLTRKTRKKEQIPAADKLLTPELIERWGLKNEWSLAGRFAKYAGPEWEGKIIYASPLVDVAATKVLANETVEMCEVILRLTGFHIRLLSKSPLLADVAEELARRLPDPRTGAKARMILGFSTGTLNDEVATAMEQHTPSPTARLKALHRLQDAGYRTYGMLCPILPQKDAAAYTAFAHAAMQAIRAEQCEEIWAEAVNFRAGGKKKKGDVNDRQQRNSFGATLHALTRGGFKEEAALFDRVARDPAAWEGYSRALFEALAEAAPEQTAGRLLIGEKAGVKRPNKLWWLHYPRRTASITEYWEAQQGKGAVLLGAIVTWYRKAKGAKPDATAAAANNSGISG